jgi:7-cyano-7-deazaguanine synthase
MKAAEEKKAVVLLSGGVDSSTTLAIAKAGGYDLYAISFDYNQRHRVEMESARKVAEAVGVSRHFTVGFDLRGIGGSALTSDMEVPKTTAGPPAASSIPSTYVPARNTIFLSFGLAWAEVLDAGSIFIGANAVDYSGYPDCRPEYLRAFEDMANLATRASVEGKIRFRIQAPLLTLRKSEIIRKGLELGLDYALTWSCYDPQPAGGTGRGGALFVPCGLCDSCRLRKKGFDEAGVADPAGLL